jgi:hypothetical protein
MYLIRAGSATGLSINGPIVVRSQARVKYERRTKTVIGSFKARQISFAECVAELDAAFEKFLAPNVDELAVVRALVLDNNSAVMQEMALRPIHLMHRKAFKAKQD